MARKKYPLSHCATAISPGNPIRQRRKPKEGIIAGITEGNGSNVHPKREKRFTFVPAYSSDVNSLSIFHKKAAKNAHERGPKSARGKRI